MKTNEAPAAAVWRMRAEHNRALSEHMSNQTTRDNLLRLATDYEIRARQEDERAETSRQKLAS
jgi:hypothetical protein